MDLNNINDFYFNKFISSTFDEKITYIVIVSGIVGSGKTTIGKIIENLMITNYSEIFDFSIISSDKLRLELINKETSLDFEQALAKTRPYFQEYFFNELKELVFTRKNKKIRIVFLDKNIPIQEIKGFSDNLNKFNKANITIKTIVLYPKILYPFKFNKSFFPFSISYIIQCYLRIKHRKNHETLDPQRDKKFYHMLLMFLALHRDDMFENLDTYEDVEICPLSIIDERMIFNDVVEKNLVEIYEFYNKKEVNEEKLNVVKKKIKRLIRAFDEYSEVKLFSDTKSLLQNEIEEIFSRKQMKSIIE